MSHHPSDIAAAFDDSPIMRQLHDLGGRRRRLEDVEIEFTGQTRVLTVSNQKGGVGKTTTTVNTAAAIAALGGRVLVIDLDPQGNASTALGIPHSADTTSIYDVLINDVSIADAVQQSPESDNLFCVPSTIHLAGA
ncbi:MAG: ParA family protein, partial [Microbacterium gubbeenense]|uniref:ParA family protein n=1 Tax=Microbacterium gubbeenense TaxID=159896 RepID=UPI003F96BBDF